AADCPVVIVHLTNRGGSHGGGARPEAGPERVCGDLSPVSSAGRKRLFHAPDYSQPRPGTSARRPSGKRPIRRFCGGACAGARSRPSPPTTAPLTLAQKDAGREDFTKIPGGLPGVETRGELIYSYGVAKRKLSLAQMCRVLSENPAKLYGLYPREGRSAAPGSVPTS
ncbi:MAG: dihydropyrimidinase, partial [Dysosmobacter sp.]